MSETVTEQRSLIGVRSVLDRLGGWQGFVDGAVPPLLFVAANTAAGLAGHGDRALPIAAATAGASTAALALMRLATGQPLTGVLRGVAGLVLAVGFALWTGRARDFFLPGIFVDGFYAVALTVSALVGRPAVGYAYAALFGIRGWRERHALRKLFAVATIGWALVYMTRFAVQALFYGQDEPELLALAKLALGWPVTAVAVILTIRVARREVANR